MEHRTNETENLLFQLAPEKQRADYEKFCNGQNASRLPYFYLFMALHRVSSVIAYLVLYPTLEVPAGLFGSTHIIYSVFYFIFIGLASYTTKKINFTFASNFKLLKYSYFLALVILIIDDFITTEIFYGIFNPIQFLSGALIIAALPIFDKKTTNILIILYLVVNMIAKIFFGYPWDAFILSSGYYGFLAVVAIGASTILKTNHQRQFVEGQIIAEQNEILKKLSDTDALTKISNRRAFDEYLTKVWEEAREKKQPISVLMMDVDRFKFYNDNFGHVEGDKCLVKIARAVEGKFLRKGDMFARFGGEEFVAITIGRSCEDMLKLAESIRANVENLKIVNPLNEANPHITLSIGFANRIPTKDDGPRSIIQLADTALYTAKQTGRNKVVADLEE
ncbi:MAG: GGDEF domain-containing protein [Defluviitaleaceae bacterium]|nr:GGDEF domain-containing protein [Defluviitaleaceae bacterium]